MEAAERKKWPLAQLLIVLVLALLVRKAAADWFPLDWQADPDGYVRLGAILHATNEFGEAIDFGPGAAWAFGHTAYRPPLYPLVVAACFFSEGAERQLLSAVHVVWGAATVALVFLLAWRWGVSRRGAWLAAALVAIDPILLKQASLPMTETLAALLAATGLLALTIAGQRLSAPASLLAGGILALAELCRPTFLVWLVLCGLGLVILAPVGRRRITIGCAFFLTAAVVIAPWAVRNYLVFGRPIITTTHGGYTLYLANNRMFYDHLAEGRWFTPWDGEKLSEPRRVDAQLRLVELENDRTLYHAVLDAILRPARHVLRCVGLSAQPAVGHLPAGYRDE